MPDGLSNVIALSSERIHDRFGNCKVGEVCSEKGVMKFDGG